MLLLFFLFLHFVCLGLGIDLFRDLAELGNLLVDLLFEVAEFGLTFFDVLFEHLLLWFLGCLELISQLSQLVLNKLLPLPHLIQCFMQGGCLMLQLSL